MTKPTNYLLYDGDCPFCSSYVRWSRLQESVPGFRLLDARENPSLVANHREAGREVNTGMILSLNGIPYHGHLALNRLALLSTRSGFLNKLNSLLFRSEAVSRFAYPLMVAGRNTALKLLGRKQLS
ncbi:MULTISPECIES: DCC1-like thiol-disulfide oxidoreductase family protein [unclassified Bradyrhizobium]|uniref:DCC1-like thiol-disulfide oxidoreductase family protein n=1 Tax=Bradyrhizobium sp. USDA 4541 TaxID=2817704 RepID=UPI0020A4C27E|nr:DCC1-like thiol-disulfide oxidoreductase family protein [Bradyrhizobium sp. USDA 4541]MCP1852777.1 putative DCC family thiol-disulfide oxidoreductase YuxK [Bradyrhizobium sp. USDA 4541]